MIAFVTFVIGVAIGLAIGAAMQSAARDLEDAFEPSGFPPATLRKIRRAERAARADLRRALGRKP